MKTILLAYPGECIGCGTCEYTCSFEHEGVFSPSLSRIRITKNESREFFSPTFCKQCEKAPCVTTCPTDALARNSKTGVVEWNKEECIRCDVCITACPFGAITFANEEILKCDLCGGDPECVKMCAAGALKFVDEDGAVKHNREAVLSKNLSAVRERVDK